MHALPWSRVRRAAVSKLGKVDALRDHDCQRGHKSLNRRFTKRRHQKQIVRWALLLAAAAAIVGIAVPNLGFGETLNNIKNGSVQRMTTSPSVDYLEGRGR